MVDAEASNAFARKGVRVRVPPRVQAKLLKWPEIHSTGINSCR